MTIEQFIESRVVFLRDRPKSSGQGDEESSSRRKLDDSGEAFWLGCKCGEKHRLHYNAESGELVLTMHARMIDATNNYENTTK